METKISSNLERCSEIAHHLQDSAFIKTRDGWQENTEVFTLAQELERLIEDLFVMTRTEDAREASIDQKLRDADIDPDALVERGLKKMTDSSDIIAETIKNLNEVYRAAMLQGEKQR